MYITYQVWWCHNIPVQVQYKTLLWIPIQGSNVGDSWPHLFPWTYQIYSCIRNNCLWKRSKTKQKTSWTVTHWKNRKDPPFKRSQSEQEMLKQNITLKPSPAQQSTTRMKLTTSFLRNQGFEPHTWHPNFYTLTPKTSSFESQRAWVHKMQKVMANLEIVLEGLTWKRTHPRVQSPAQRLPTENHPDFLWKRLICLLVWGASV